MSPEQRPRWLGYAIGAALIAIGAVVVITMFVVFQVRVTGKMPTDDHSFDNNQTTTVHVDAGGTKAIYTNPSTDANIRCTVRDLRQRNPARGDVPSVSPYIFGFVVTSQWRGKSYFKVNHAGDYTVSCSGPSDVRYGVGEYVSVEQFTDLLWGIGAGVVLVIGGFGTLIVTLVRRARVNKPPPPMQYPQQWPPRY